MEYEKYKQIAEFSVEEDTIKKLFAMFTPYYKQYGDSEGFNILCEENFTFIELLGFDVCWAILFSDWPGNYFRIPHRKRKYRAPSQITPVEWLSIRTKYNFQCFYCGKQVERLTKDHVVPIFKNGPDTVDNIVPACWPCNRKKNTRLVEVFKEGAMIKLL